MHLWSFVVAPSVWSVLFASNHNRPHTRVQQQQQQQHSTVRRLFWTTTPPAVRRTTFVLASPEEPPAEPPSRSRTTVLLDSNATVANGDTTTTTTTKATSSSSSSNVSSSSSSQSSVSESTTMEPATVSDHSFIGNNLDETSNKVNDNDEMDDSPTNTSPYNLSDWLNQIYVDLEQPGLYNRYVTPSLRFSVVTPPTRNGTSTWMDPHSYYQDDKDTTANTEKPLAVFLPGLDGYGLSAARHQYDDLARTFECWRLVVLPEDRTPFGELVNHICDFVVDLASPSSTTTNAKNHIRPVTLIGESCGGLVAAAVALQLEQRYGGSSSTSTSDDQDKEPQPRRKTNQKKQKNPYLQGLVLVNPATSFDQTNWDALVPLLTALPSSSSQDNNNNNQNNLTPYGVVGSLILAALIPDSEQRQQILSAITSLPTFPPRNLQDLQDNWGAMQASFQITEERLPADVLQFRVSEWVDVGDAIVRPRWSLLRPLPTLLVVGEQDALLPSAQEATRLASAEYLPHAETLKVPNRGHFVLDNAVNLTEAILYSQIDPLDWKGEGTITTTSSKTTKKKKRYDPIVDWKRPSSEAIETYVQQQVRPLQRAFSPVFFSTDAKGKRWRGLSKLPQMHFAQNGQAGSSSTTTANRPLLLVGNHQLLAVDLGLLLTELYQQQGWLPRGLAHPVSFTPTSNEFAAELLGRTPGLTGPNRNAGPTAAFQTFGAVQVSPRNYYRLMQTGQPTMLFPGGAREALTGGRSDYPLFWPDKTDFVRTAVKFNATIVPFSAVGMAESAQLVLTYEQLQRVPFLANALANATTSPTDNKDDETGSGTSASRRRRMSARMDATNETDLQADLVLPTLPARNYFLFGPAMDTSAIDHKDLNACQTLYDQLQEQVRTGLDDLLEARKDDPFANTPRRVLYEQVWGKQAPTFSVDKL